MLKQRHLHEAKCLPLQCQRDRFTRQLKQQRIASIIVVPIEPAVALCGSRIQLQFGCHVVQRNLPQADVGAQRGTG